MCGDTPIPGRHLNFKGLGANLSGFIGVSLYIMARHKFIENFTGRRPLFIKANKNRIAKYQKSMYLFLIYKKQPPTSNNQSEQYHRCDNTRTCFVGCSDWGGRGSAPRRSTTGRAACTCSGIALTGTSSLIRIWGRQVLGVDEHGIDYSQCAHLFTNTVSAIPCRCVPLSTASDTISTTIALTCSTLGGCTKVGEDAIVQ